MTEPFGAAGRRTAPSGNVRQKQEEMLAGLVWEDGSMHNTLRYEQVSFALSIGVDWSLLLSPFFGWSKMFTVAGGAS